MHHYVAFLWQATDPQASRAALTFTARLENSAGDWQLAFVDTGMAVYTRPPVERAMRTYRLQGTHGIIFGRLFSNTGMAAPLTVPVSESHRMATSAGKHLLDNYWGNYVAILNSRMDHKHYVIRDCSGRLPCYYTIQDGVNICFSYAGDIVPLACRFTLNDQYLARSITCHPLHLRETALHQVKEVLAGDCMMVSEAQTDHYPLWSPYVISDGPVIDDYDTALRGLRQTTERCLHLWAELYDRILLSLSGGLDSAIVLGCLKRRGLADRVICVTRFTDGCSGDDERSYARAAARMAGTQLIELPRPHDGSSFFDAIHGLPLQPKPDVSHLVRILSFQSSNLLAEKYDCSTIWTGQGGDQLFLQVAHPYGAVDYVMRHLSVRRSAAAVYDSAVLSGTSIWSVISKVLRCGVARRQALPETERTPDMTFVTPLVSSQLSARIHTPSLDQSDQMPPGKRIQIESIVDLVNRHRPLVACEAPYEQHPLVSQPLIEMALRIPTYHLQRGGQARALARAAFADCVPPSILAREDKGDTTSQIRSLLRGSAHLLAETMVDGLLVQRGILRRKPLERIFKELDTYRTADIFPLLSCIAAEIWARRWSDTITDTGPSDHRAIPGYAR